MSQTSRKKRPLKREKGVHRDAHLIIIATEGEKTEKQYFEFPVFSNSHIKIHVLETKDGYSAPRSVKERLDAFCKEFDFKKGYDQLWVVVDKDRIKNNQLSEVQRDARKKKYGFALSNPCFELWLLLHHKEQPENIPVNKENITEQLNEILRSYNKSNINSKDYEEHIEKAIANAKALDNPPQNGWPENPGTHVYKLVKQILKLKRCESI